VGTLALIAWETAEPTPSICARASTSCASTAASTSPRPRTSSGPRPDWSDVSTGWRARSHRLRLHEKGEDTGAAKAIAEALRENVPLDPHEPVFEDVFAEPDHWYRHVRDHLGPVWRRLRVAVGPPRWTRA
jgi:hypothetical protein